MEPDFAHRRKGAKTIFLKELCLLFFDFGLITELTENFTALYCFF